MPVSLTEKIYLSEQDSFVFSTFKNPRTREILDKIEEMHSRPQSRSALTTSSVSHAQKGRALKSRMEEMRLLVFPYICFFSNVSLHE